MKVEIERGAFAEIVGGAAKALAARPVTPVLAGVLLSADAEQGTLRAAAFDFELAVRATAPAAVGESGTALVSGRLLAEITRVLPGLPVRLVLEGGHLVLTCGAYRYTLACMPVAEYPALPAFPATVGTVGGAALAIAAARAAMAAERDDTLPFLTGARIEFGPAYLRLVSTDRYRLARVDVPWQPSAAPLAQSRTGAQAAQTQESARAGTAAEPRRPVDAAAGESEPGSAALVPARALLEAAKLLPGAEPVRIGHGEGLLGLASGGLELTLRQLDGEFIRYAQLFPDEYVGEAVLEVAPLIEAIRAIALVAERHTPGPIALPGADPPGLPQPPDGRGRGYGHGQGSDADAGTATEAVAGTDTSVGTDTGTARGTGAGADSPFHYLFIPSRGAERG